MKTTEIAKKYELDNYEFERFLRENKLDYEEKFFGTEVEDKFVQEYVTLFKNEKEQIMNEELSKKKAMAQ